MTRRSPYNQTEKKAEILHALFECYGIVTSACKKIGLCRDTYYQWYRADPEFAKACDATEVSTHGMVQDILLTKILEKDTASIIFYCKTKMKHMGYIERVEHTGANGEAIKNELTVKASQTDMEILESYKHKLLKDVTPSQIPE